MGDIIKDMTTKFGKLNKFEGNDFRSRYKKMHFFLTTLKVVYMLSTPMSEFVEDETLEQTKKRCKWEDGDYIYRGHILNEDASSKKFLVSNFNNYKMVDSRGNSKGERKGKEIAGYSSVDVIKDGKNKNKNKNNKANKRKNDGNKVISNKKSKLTCWKCGKTGHFKKYCRVKKNNGGNTFSSGQGSKDPNSSQGLNFDFDVIPSNYYVSHIYEICYVQDDVFAWWIDSGATCHACKDRCWLDTFHPVPSQNEVSKRKNHHLLEVARAILFQMTVPKPFWVDAVSTTCFLINCMPSAVLGGNYPYAVLFPTKPLFPINPKIFGITTYRHHEENDDLLVYVSPTHIETTKQSAELDGDGPPLKDVSNDVPISAPSEAYGKSDVPSDAPSGFDSPLPCPAPKLDLPIALRKVKRTCRYLVSAFVSYDGLSTSSRAFVANLDSILVLKTVGEALAHYGWRAAMIEEMNALYHNGTWALVDLLAHKKPIGCKWVFSVKMNPDGSIGRLKARLVAEGYAQTYGIDYSETFSSVAKIYSIRLFISFAATYDWALHQLDVKNAFLHDFLDDRGQIEAKPYDEPMIPKLKLRSEDGRLLHNPEKYRRVVGKLNYLTITRPDIAYPISVVSQFLTAPRTSYWEAVTQILGYLKGTPGFGILYANHRHHIAEGFTYADYAGCPNTSRSSMGYCVFVGGNLVSWKIITHLDPIIKLMPNIGRAVDQLEYSREIGFLMYAMTSTRPYIAYVVGKLGRGFKEASITDSRIEAEFVALAAAGKEAGWLSNLIYEISLWPKLISPISIHCDSATTLAKAYYQIYNVKSGHLGVRHNMDVALIDLPMGGRMFTWMNKSGSKLSKLDRFLISNSVLLAHSNMQVLKSIFLRQIYMALGVSSIEVERMVAGWKANMLSSGGHLTLIKSVLGSLGIYYFSIFKAPEVVIKILESLRASFFWGATGDKRKLAWIKWSNILASLEKGGLRVDSLKAFNNSLLLKWIWRLLKSPSALWVKVLKSIDGDEMGIELKGCQNKWPLSSHCWYDVLSSLKWICSFALSLFQDRIVNGLWTWNWRRPVNEGRLQTEFNNILVKIGLLNIEVDSDCVVSSFHQMALIPTLSFSYSIFFRVICFIIHSRRPPSEMQILSVLLKITLNLATKATRTPLSSPKGTMWCLFDLTPSGWCKTDAHSMDFGLRIQTNTIRIKVAIDLNVFQQDPSLLGRILLLVSLLNSFHRKGLQNSAMTPLCSNNIKESLFLKHGLVLRTYSKKSLIMASIFGPKSKSFINMSIPSQDEPSINRPVASFVTATPKNPGHYYRTAPSMKTKVGTTQGILLSRPRQSLCLKMSRVHPTAV
nr:copia protein [Tanacetum cinerariifolium]